MAKSVVNIRGADQIMKLLHELPKSVTTGKTGGVVAKALRKGARVILNEEKKTLPRAIAVGGVYSTGQLEKKLTIKRKKHNGKGEKMQISVRSGKYTVTPEGKQRSAKAQMTFYGAARMLEYGSSRQPATPWARPAFNAKAAEAISTTEQTLLKDLEKIAQKHMPKAK